jgi:hypothetical protein
MRINYYYYFCPAAVSIEQHNSITGDRRHDRRDNGQFFLTTALPLNSERLKK